MSLSLFVLVSIIFARSLASNEESTVEVEVTTSGDIENVDVPVGFAESGPPVDPPLVFRSVEKPPSTQYWVTFINKSPEPVELVWDDGGRKGRLQATLQPNESSRIGTFEGHIFFYRYPGSYKKEQKCFMKNGQTLFEFKDEETRRREAKELQEEKRIFKQKYYERTGRKWEAFYPRKPPIHYVYPAEYVGQRHKVTSNHSFYHCYPVTDSAEDVSKCRDDNILQFEWEVKSISPRVIYLAQPFLSDFEIEHIQTVATPKLTESTVGHGEGAYASATRTSKGCFIDRCETDVIDWIFRRIADVTKVPEAFLWHMIGSENLQVLRYDENQQFKAHNDYNTEREQMRYLTFLMYFNTLNEDQGGATTFPLANLSVTPVKGHVAAFYSVLEDGNSDYMSLHASTPIKYGVKWSAPVWIWDPILVTMERDCLCQLIQLQYNQSRLSDEQFNLFCVTLVQQLTRSQFLEILFCGLNSMRMKGDRSCLATRDIIHKASKITSEITTKQKTKLKERKAEQHIVANHKVIRYSDVSYSVMQYLCDYLDIRSLLNLQLTCRYFCVVTHKQLNYSLLLTVSPYHAPATIDVNIYNNQFNSGYYEKCFIPIRKVGSGSYGSVYVVNHVVHGIYLGKFAIKLICVGDDFNRLVDILREVRTLQPLHHRNVIDYKHAWLEHYQPAVNAYGAPKIPCLFILMEYADMGSVYDYVMRSAPRSTKWLPEHEIWTMVFETCMALQHLHEHGIVHRDIKPANILMTSLHKRHKIEYKDLELYNTDYRIVISDLGQADFVHCKESIPQTGNTGAVGFAAPEMVLRSTDNSNVNQWDEAVDIWSLGQLLYFLSFSRMPYQENNDMRDIEIKLFYKDIVNGSKKLWFPPNHGRSVIITKMIHTLCHIEPEKRPSLDSVIDAVCNILRSHQYASVSYSNNHPNRRFFGSTLKALTASEQFVANEAPNVSQYPVVKYTPKCTPRLFI